MSTQGLGIFGVASKAAYGSAVVSAVGVLFLLLMYAGFLLPAKGLLVFGPLNDACVLLQYLLALPLVFAFHRLPVQVSPRLRIVALTIGLSGILGAVVLQALLLVGLLSFREQIAYASLSVLLVGVWILLTGLLALGSSLGGMTVRLRILAALYFGYPFWAYRVGQQLELHRRATES